MARQRRTLDEQIAELVTRGRSSRTEVQSVPAMAPVGSDMINEGAIDHGHIKEGAINPIAFSPEVRQTFDDLESGLQGNGEAARELGEKITELKEVTLPALDKDLAESKKNVEALNGRLSPIDAGLALLKDQQVTVSAGITELRDTTIPALGKDLTTAKTRLDSADVLLKETFPKLISDAQTAVDRLAANAGNLAPYGDLEGFGAGSYFSTDPTVARSGSVAFHRVIGTTAYGHNLPDIPVTPGNWYQVSYWIRADRDFTTNGGMPVTWVNNSGVLVNSNWGEGYKSTYRGPLTPNTYQRVSFDVQAGADIKAMRPRFYIWNAVAGHADIGTKVWIDDFQLQDVTAATAAQRAAIAASRLETEAAEARVAVAAANDAKTKADAAQAAALAAAKTYAEAQASGASESTLAAAKADATSKANAAQAAAITAAALDATAKKEQAEANAALDAKNKADKALADAKLDATAKADKARNDALTAAALDAQTKATAAQNAAVTAAALEADKKVATAKQATLTAAATDAQTKATTAQAAAEAAAATAAQLMANGAKADAITAAQADATSKANTAKQAAIDAAAADATSKANKAKTDAITAAASDATGKANSAQAAAISAAATDATGKANEAERLAKIDAAAAKTAADNAASAASSAAGLAASKGKVLVQSTAPGADDRNAMTLWIDTTSGNNTPKRWSTGTTWLAVTDKKAADAAAAAATAQSAADAAAAAAVTAQSAADAAMTAAGNLNQVYYSTANPTGIAPIGSTWRKRDAAGNIIGEWRYAGGTTPWQAQLISTQAISNLDVGKLTAGTAAMDTAVISKLAAATASIQQADIGNLTVTGASKMNTVVAEKMGAAVGEFVYIDIGTGTFGEMGGDRIKVGTLEAQHLLVGSFGNLIPNGAGEYGKAGAWSSRLTWDATDKPDGLPGSVKGKSANSTAVLFDVEPGAEYKFEMWVKADLPNSRMYFEFRDQDGNFGVTARAIPGQANGVSGAYPVGNYTVPTAWTKLSAIVTTAATTSKLRVGNIYLNHTNGTEKNATVSMAGVRLIRRSDGTLIVNGSVNADHVDAESVGAAVGTFVKADIGNLVVSGTTKLTTAVAKRIAADTGTFIELGVDQLTAVNANFTTAVADKMFSNIFATRKLFASQVYIGEGGNLFPSDFTDDAWASGTGFVFSATGGKAGGSSALIPGASSQVGSYYAIGTADRGKLPRVIPGESYRVKANVRSDAAIPKGGAAVYLRLYPTTGTGTAYTWATPGSVTNSEPIPALTWGVVEGIVTIPTGTVNTALAPGIYANASATGAIRFSELSIQSAISPGLVVDGLMDAKRIVGASIETVDEANQGIKLTAKNGIQVFNSSGVQMLQANTNGVTANGKFEATAVNGRVEMSAELPGAAVPTRYNAGLQFFGSGDSYRGRVYTGYGISGVSIEGPDIVTSIDLLDSGMNISGRTMKLNTASPDGVQIQQGTFPATRVPIGILSRWDSSSAIAVSTNTTILSRAVKVPPKATIRVTVNLGGYPSANAQYMDINAYADGVEFGKSTHHSPGANFGTDVFATYHFTSTLTTEKSVTFRVAGTTAVPASSIYTIPARAAGAAPSATIIFEDLGNV